MNARATARLAWQVRGGTPARRRALRARARALAIALGSDPLPADASVATSLAAVEGRLRDATPAQVWLVHAVLAGRLPPPEATLRSLRRAEIGGGAAVVADAVERAIDRIHDLAPDGDPAGDLPMHDHWPPVRIVTGHTVVVVDDLAARASDTVDPRQQLTREVLRRWRDRDDVLFVHTVNLGTALRPVPAVELDAVLAGRPILRNQPPDQVIVPTRCRVVLTELPDDPNRGRTLTGLVRFSDNVCTAIAHADLAAAAAGRAEPGEGDAVARRLYAARNLHRVVATSETAAREQRGWRTVVRAGAAPGPDVVVQRAPVAWASPADHGPITAGSDVSSPLVVISSDPDRLANQDGALHAVGQLWREGFDVRLIAAGTNPEPAPLVAAAVAELAAAGRPAEVHAGLSPSSLASVLAEATVLLHPAFDTTWPGLVVQADELGVAIITARSGLLAEYAPAAVLVDPTDDAAIIDALRSAVTNPSSEPNATATAVAGSDAAAERWTAALDTYAAGLWAALTAD